jgi:uncharacterized protein YfaS (alpha-2-macroglobulin family)
MSYRAASAPFLLSLFIVSASCLESGRPAGSKLPPAATLSDPGDGAHAPHRPLAPESAELGGLSSKHPFGVVFAGPRGDTVDPSEVTVVFNRPMRPLSLAGDEQASPVAITLKGSATSPKGAWRWIGTSALVFQPEGRLPKATAFVVTIPGDTRALDGSTLGTPYTFELATPAPKLVRVDPPEGSSHLLPGATFDLRFNQGVAPAEVERAVKLVAGEKPVRFRATRPKKDAPGLVRITPSSRLPLASSVEIDVDASLRGVEGPIPVGEPSSTSFSTYGPLEVSSLECSRSIAADPCNPRGYVGVRLSNAVPMASWKAHVRLEGPKGQAIPLDWRSQQSDQPGDFGDVNATLEPARSYTVVVTAGLRDEYGQTLASDVRLKFGTKDYEPSVTLGVSGSVFEAPTQHLPGGERQVPIGSVNLDSYDLVTASLDEAQVAELQKTERSVYRPGDRFTQASELKGASVEVVHPPHTQNVTSLRTIKLDTVLGRSGGRGAALVAVRASEPNGLVDDVRVVSVSDLAISAKVSLFGTLVWVTHLSDGTPAPHAAVSIRDAVRVLAAATTDADGFAVFPPSVYSPGNVSTLTDPGRIVVARLGGDWTWRSAGDFAVDGDLYGPGPMGMLFTERGIYKTGETAKVKGIFRIPTPRGASTPRGEDVTVTLNDATGTAFFTGSAALDPFGAFSVDAAIPDTAHLGPVSVTAELAETSDHSAGSAQTSAQIAAYRPAEFKVAVDSGRPSYMRGDRATFAVRGDYLYGAPMGGGDVRYTVTRSVTSFTPPGTEDFVTSDVEYLSERPYEGLRAGEIASGNGTLDAHGTFSAKQSLALPHQQTPEMVSFEAEVTDVSRQTIAGRAGVLVHPAQIYLALAPPKDLFVDSGKPIHAGALAVTPSGERRAGVPLTLELIKRTWRSTWEASGETAHASPSVVDENVASCTVTSAAEPAGCDLAPGGPGYFVLRVAGKDAKGNEAHASAAVYAMGDGEVGWRFSDRPELELVPDKAMYEPGEVARILVKSPFPEADALVTVERAGIYRKERVHLTGSMPTLSVPITGDLRPNAFVSVHIVRGRTKEAPPRGADVGAPAYRAGSVSLTVNPESRRLKVEVKPAKKDLRPADDVDADVMVRDHAGKPVKGEVTFYAVDEGVLSLTAYRTPDPLPPFVAPRSDNMATLESRADLAHVFFHAGNVGVDKGDEGGGGGGVRADFRSTAYFEPALLTDEHGHVHVHFKLPDSLTTYRLMAVAVAEDDRFGSGQAGVTVSRPLMARPNLPRFLRAGDAVEAGVILSSKGMGATQVEVALDAKGVEVVGAAKQTIQLPANGNVEVRWAMRAPTPGKATFAFQATTGKEHDAVTITRDVEVPLSPESVALYGDTTRTDIEQLGDLSGMRSDVGGLDVRLASSALVGLDDGVEQLLEYPYGCTEQLSSRLVPLVALRTLAKDYGIALPENVGPVVNETVAKIEANQQPDGGYGWWPDSKRSDAWLTAYAVWTLATAQKDGAQVSVDKLHAAETYLHESIPSLFNETLGRSIDAFLLDVLATIGLPDYGYMGRLYDERAKMPLFARALLAHAMAISNMAQALPKELARDFEDHLRVTGAGATVAENLGDEYAVVLDSEARTTAMVLRALLAIDPAHPLASRLAKGLLAARNHGTWRSTDESAWALLALDDYRRAQERVAPNFDASILVGGTKVAGGSFHGKTVESVTKSIPAAALLASSGATLAFEVDGTGKLFFEARLHYARRDLPTAGLDRGFYVRKTVRTLKPADLKAALATLPDSSASSAVAGDLVLVDLVVVTQDPREQVVIDDPLPAGLEAVQASLATTAQSLDVTEGGGEGEQDDEASRDDDTVAAGSAWSQAWFHREYRDDRVVTFVDHMEAGMYHYRYLARATTHGTFVVPPTRAECMYEPETFGRTAGATFVVSARGP